MELKVRSLARRIARRRRRREREAKAIGFLAAIRFLTTLPVPGSSASQALTRSVGWFPLIGLLIGAIMAGLDALLQRVFPPVVTAALVVAALTLLTGGLHLEGLADAADGLFGGHTIDERLRIMRDPTAGAYAIISIVLVLLLKATAIASLGEPRWPALLLFPALGRWSMVWAIVSFPYARKEGLGTAFRAGRLALTLASITVFVATAALFQVQSIVPLGVTAIAAMATTGLMLRRLRGLTGDCYGALNEICEVAALLALVALPQIWP